MPWKAVLCWKLGLPASTPALWAFSPLWPAPPSPSKRWRLPLPPLTTTFLPAPVTNAAPAKPLTSLCPPSPSGWHNSSSSSRVPRGHTEPVPGRLAEPWQTWSPALLSPSSLQTSGTRALLHTQALQPSPHARLLSTAKMQLHVWLPWLPRAMRGTRTPAAPTAAQGRCHLPGFSLAVSLPRDREARLQWGWHPARSRGQDEGGGMLWTSRVFFQMQPLARNSPVTGDINRGEKKLLFSEREG